MTCEEFWNQVSTECPRTLGNGGPAPILMKLAWDKCEELECKRAVTIRTPRGRTETRGRPLFAAANEILADG